jgi:hypothetical protein
MFVRDKENKAQERLEALLLRGLESGDPIPVTPKFWKELWARVDSKKQTRSSGSNASVMTNPHNGI